MDTLEGRRVLVTGASSGIGRAVAEAVVAAGGHVALLARTASTLEHLATELSATRTTPDRRPEGDEPPRSASGPQAGPGNLPGPAAVAVPADVTDAEAAANAVARASAALGGLDAVVNAAGVVRPGGITVTGPDDWRATLEVNVLGLLQVSAAAVEHLGRAPVADIVNISSMSGRRRASVAMTVYSASKHAVHVISDGLREELAAHGIRVTVISPGYVRTPIFDSVADEELRSRYQQALAAQGLDPEAVAAQVVHALGQPAGVDLVEIAVMSTRQ